MNRPRRWLGGASITTATIVIAAALTAWDRLDKMIESRDAWRDRAMTTQRELGDLKRRVDDQDKRDLRDELMRKNTEAKDQWEMESLALVMSRMGIKPPPGPYLVDLPPPVARLRIEGGGFFAGLAAPPAIGLVVP